MKLRQPTLTKPILPRADLTFEASREAEKMCCDLKNFS